MVDGIKPRILLEMNIRMNHQIISSVRSDWEGILEKKDDLKNLKKVKLLLFIVEKLLDEKLKVYRAKKYKKGVKAPKRRGRTN
jgi:hypothetical protein